MTHAEQIRRKVRAQLGYHEISAREMAGQIGMSRSALASRLTGDVEFRVSELQRIAEALDIPLARLLPAAEPEGVR